MQEYQKIETLLEFDNEKKIFKDKFYSPYVEYLRNCPWIVSEKIDGTNVRVHFDGHRVEWNGRTDNANLDKNVQELLQKTFGESEVIFEQTFGGKDVYLFMECYGGKIQGGAYGGQERLIGFDVMVGNMYLDKLVIKDIFAKFNVPCVPFREIPNLQEAINEVSLDAYKNIVSEYCENKKTPIEGLVCVPKVRIYDNQGKRIIVKIKCKDLRKSEGFKLVEETFGAISKTINEMKEEKKHEERKEN